MGIFGPILGLCLLCLPAYIASQKGRSFLLFFLLTLVFWPAALILALISPDYNKRDVPPRRKFVASRRPAPAPAQAGHINCPDCGESIPSTSRVCSFCNVILMDRT
jgi:hypothetical protein